jgi:hypothetical protein
LNLSKKEVSSGAYARISDGGQDILNGRFAVGLNCGRLGHMGVGGKEDCGRFFLQTEQRVPTTSPRSRRADGKMIGHALTFKPEHSMGATINCCPLRSFATGSSEIAGTDENNCCSVTLEPPIS